jgi:hypothetical protein
VPAEPALKALAESLGVEGHGIGDLVHDEKIQSEVLKQLQSVGKKAGLASMEIVVGCVLADEEVCNFFDRFIILFPCLARLDTLLECLGGCGPFKRSIEAREASGSLLRKQ